MASANKAMTKDEKFVIFASSTGTVFEWYDFYLYATLAPFFAGFAKPDVWNADIPIDNAPAPK